MSQGPFLIFDKSSLESLNLDEAIMLDNFYMSNITPLFFVECLADLEKIIRSKSTPEQLVGSLAERTPDAQSSPNVHHATILRGELSGQFDLTTVHGRVMRAGGRHVQLGDKKGVVFEHSKEAEAVSRWSKGEFIDLERNIARQWRRALTAIDLDAMVRNVMGALGHWRKPKSLEDARQMADTIIDNMDPEWLLRFGLDLVGAPETIEYVVGTWIQKRRPPLREYLPYFVFVLTINIFFCLVLPAQLLRHVKPSHKVDLAYLYYLPFCMVFTSKDNFHAEVVPLFLRPEQTFVNGIDLMMRRRLILSLCDHTGNWSRPYAEDPAYEVVRVDVLDGRDVRLLPHIGRPVHGILAAPPCTHFSTAQGVRSWGKKGTEAVIEAMSVVDACMRMVVIYRPYWWALENPPGRLKNWIGPFSWSFQPCEYGGYLEAGEKTLDCPLFPANDAFTKRTLIWGTAGEPLRKPVPVAHVVRPEGGWRNKCFKQHKEHRAVTPMGFSRAFKEKNP